MKLVVTDSQAGQRADVVVTAMYPDLTRSAVHVLFEKQLVSLSHEPVKAGYKVRIGDTLFIQDQLLHQETATINLPILYEDTDVVVINKPIGVLTHEKGVLTNEATVATFIAPKYQGKVHTNRSGIVHRLDRATSGVIICGKNEAAVSWLQKQFSTRKTKKTYVAIVDGVVEPPEAIIDAPIERNPKHPQTFRVGAQGKTAQTHYTVQKQADTWALIQLQPTTGRTHQLRVHMQYIGHSIIGDPLYSTRKADRLYLHALKLEITLPSRERKVFEAPLPAEFSTYHG